MTPLIRSGPKGTGEFRSATWDEALDLVAGRIQEALADDPATVVPYLYNSSAGSLGGGLLGQLLWDALGASQVDHTICAASTGRAWSMTFGAMPGADPFDVVHAQLVVVWGANPAISNTHLPAIGATRPGRRGHARGDRPASNRHGQASRPPLGGAARHRRGVGHGRRP